MRIIILLFLICSFTVVGQGTDPIPSLTPEEIIELAQEKIELQQENKNLQDLVNTQAQQIINQKNAAAKSALIIDGLTTQVNIYKSMMVDLNLPGIGEEKWYQTTEAKLGFGFLAGFTTMYASVKLAKGL